MASQGKQPMCRSYSTTGNPDRPDETTADQLERKPVKDHRTQARLAEFKRSISDGGYTHSELPKKENASRGPSGLANEKSPTGQTSDDVKATKCHEMIEEYDPWFPWQPLYNAIFNVDIEIPYLVTNCSLIINTH
ncbi:hypothetical protein LOTGIDRAFT_229919 [Lottia gigantea]|uniref:Uncharacterized protein n=1 Tax=Lottia gigantea TaxID=225164 RepID=V4BB95_LOTGI|nr:hypothetical protein LOTGIDRAFT_229919 [Lottia gigantea]ESP04821.1 hypothetical protein LOTGIDRAFT_229919 [Lottia gigantea]